MAILGDFGKRSLIEQILALDEVEKQGGVEAIPELMALLEQEAGDETLRHAVSDTLRTLLAASEADVERGLSSPVASTRRMCVQIAGQQGFSSARPTLLRLAEAESDPELLVQILVALRGASAADVVPLCRTYLDHPDPMVSAAAIEMAGLYQDAGALRVLRGLVERAEDGDRYEMCAVATEKAIEALSALGSDEALGFLVSKIHHRNPTARRIIHQEIVRAGARALPHLSALFEGDDIDQRILSANLLGMIGDRRGADVLVGALDRKAAQHPNIRFAVFEALGRLPSLKGLVCLMDGLSETDDMILMAVVGALDEQLNPGVVARVSALLEGAPDQGAKIARAMAASGAVRLFSEIHAKERAADRVIEEVKRSKDAEVLSAFKETLAGLPGDRARAYLASLDELRLENSGERVLVVDDSKSMLLFYKSVGCDMGLDVVVAGNGKEGLAAIEQGVPYALIITDLNMPLMDGIEFSRKVRAGFYSNSVPILMATTESEASQRDLAEKAGVSGFLHKPLDPGALKEAIRRYLPASS